MSYLRRIAEIPKTYEASVGPKCVRDLFFMVKAFLVMRDIAISYEAAGFDVTKDCANIIDTEFEERMKNETQPAN